MAQRLKSDILAI